MASQYDDLDDDLDDFAPPETMAMSNSEDFEKLNLAKRELEVMLVVVEFWCISDDVRRNPLMREAMEALDNLKLDATMLVSEATAQDTKFQSVERRYTKIMTDYVEMKRLFSNADGDEDGEGDQAYVTCMSP